MMTSLTTSPVLVALVQTASTLPVFCWACPAEHWQTFWIAAALHLHAVLGGGGGVAAVRRLGLGL